MGFVWSMYLKKHFMASIIYIIHAFFYQINNHKKIQKYILIYVVVLLCPAVVHDTLYRNMVIIIIIDWAHNESAISLGRTYGLLFPLNIFLNISCKIKIKFDNYGPQYVSLEMVMILQKLISFFYNG